jgi:hypothetical protein
LAPFVAAAAIPLLFLHVRYQPSVSAGGTTVTLADVAVAAIVLVAIGIGLSSTFRPLAYGKPLWIALGAFTAWILVTSVRGRMLSSGYPLGTHLTTAAKFVEYMLIAPALVLIVRTARDLTPILGAFALWSALASLVGVVQFTGVGIFGGWPAGWRQPSFVGVHDFGALSGAALAIGMTSLVLGARHGQATWIARVAGIAGAVGVVLAGTVAVLSGVVLATAAIAIVALSRHTLTRRRGGALAAILAVVTLGMLSLRGTDIRQYLHFLGVARPQPAKGIQTYAQRTVLTYIGLRIFVAHPVMGAGWHASTDQWAYQPYLAAAHRKFPHASLEGFPSPAHPWGLQSAYIEALADMGIVGLALFVGVFGTAAFVGGRLALRGPPSALQAATIGTAWVLLAFGSWSGMNLDAGLPLDALTWIGVGLVAVAARLAKEEPAHVTRPSEVRESVSPQALPAG